MWFSTAFNISRSLSLREQQHPYLKTAQPQEQMLRRVWQVLRRWQKLQHLWLHSSLLSKTPLSLCACQLELASCLTAPRHQPAPMKHAITSLPSGCSPLMIVMRWAFLSMCRGASLPCQQPLAGSLSCHRLYLHPHCPLPGLQFLPPWCLLHHQLASGRRRRRRHHRQLCHPASQGHRRHHHHQLSKLHHHHLPRHHQALKLHRRHLPHHCRALGLPLLHRLHQVWARGLRPLHHPLLGAGLLPPHLHHHHLQGSGEPQGRLQPPHHPPPLQRFRRLALQHLLAAAH